MRDAVEVRYRSAGTDLVAWTRGQGRAVIMLHGSGLATHGMFTALAQDLSSSSQVVVCDIRGFGRSVSRDPGAHTWAQYAADVASLLDHLNLSKAVVCGYSFGAGVAIATALRHPDRVSGLVIVAPGYAGTEIGQTEPQRAVWAAGRSFFEQARRVGLETALLEPGVTEPEVDTVRRTAVRRDVACHDELSFLAAHEGELATAQPFSRLSDLRSVTAPALLMAGTDDAHDPRIAAWYVEQLPDVTVAAAPSADPVSWAPAMRSFLERCDDPRGGARESSSTQ